MIHVRKWNGSRMRERVYTIQDRGGEEKLGKEGDAWKGKEGKGGY